MDEAGHGVEARLGQVGGEVPALGEIADAERVAIGGQHGDALAHMFGCRAVHDGAEPRLELPGALARGDDERRAAEPRHADLEGRERAQRGIEEHQAQDPADERAERGAIRSMDLEVIAKPFPEPRDRSGSRAEHA